MPTNWVPVEAEAALLGACLTEPDTIIDLASQLAPCDFGLPAHEWIAGAIWTCFDERILPGRATIISKLRQAGRWADHATDKAACPADLEQLEKAADLQNVPSNAITVRECSFRRKANTSLTRTAGKIMDASLPFNSLQATVLESIGTLFETVTKRDASIDGIGLERLAGVDEGQGGLGIRTGIDWLDDATGGLQPAETWVIGAPYKQRKTTIALNIVLTVAQAGQPVSVFTAGDSSREATWDKLLALQMNQLMLDDPDYARTMPASSQMLRRRMDAELMELRNRAAEKLRRQPIRLYDGRDLTANLQEVERNIRRDAALFGLSTFVYDYAQAADCGKNDYEKTTFFASWNQRVIGELGISSIILSQQSEETIRGNGESYSPGAKGGGALPAMANYFINVKYQEPNITIELKLARDSAMGGKYTHRLNPASGLITDPKGMKEL